jgi:tRNA threonylcarbamoyl adenosine modification protein (Sua5/YciO/YrdC/YwlC family)
MAAADVAKAIAAIRAGEAVLIPADGVYGLCASAYREGPVRRLYEVKGRDEGQPFAMIAASVDMLIECVPELRGRSEVIVRTLLPGPFTLVLRNPARRYTWLNGSRLDTIGVRVAELPTDSQRVLDTVGAVAATSANEPGKPSPAALSDVPERIRASCGAEIDAGRLSGLPSTVIDFSAGGAVVLRVGAGDPEEAVALVSEALGGSLVG